MSHQGPNAGTNTLALNSLPAVHKIVGSQKSACSSISSYFLLDSQLTCEEWLGCSVRTACTSHMTPRHPTWLQELQQVISKSSVICTCVSFLSLRQKVRRNNLEGGRFNFAHGFQDTVSLVHCFYACGEAGTSRWKGVAWESGSSQQPGRSKRKSLGPRCIQGHTSSSPSLCLTVHQLWPHHGWIVQKHHQLRPSFQH